MKIIDGDDLKFILKVIVFCLVFVPIIFAFGAYVDFVGSLFEVTTELE